MKNFNRTRRALLKTGALGGAAVVMPAAANAWSAAYAPNQVPPSVEIDVEQPVSVLSPVLENDGISIEITDQAIYSGTNNLALVSLSNYSDTTVTLAHLSPGAVTTANGIYNINARLARKPIMLSPGATYHIWLRPDQEPVEIPPASVGGNNHCSMIPVTVKKCHAPGARTAGSHTRLSHAIFV